MCPKIFKKKQKKTQSNNLQGFHVFIQFLY